MLEPSQKTPWHFSLQAISANSILIIFCDVNTSEQNNRSPKIAAQPTPELCETIRRCSDAITTSLIGKVHDVVSAYNTIVVHFDVTQTDHEHLISSIIKIIPTNITPTKDSNAQGRKIQIPVYYGDETGPDLVRIAEAHNISVKEVIQIHCDQPYTAYAVGFAPGFAYLGFVPLEIKMPRLASPRKKVIKGSVAIADQQTAIYPNDSPGGWNIIGRTPSDMLKEENQQITSHIKSGDTVSFYAISREEFLELGGVL